MKATIAINNYNYSSFLIDCINSALNQTYKNIEVLVVDDGSTDNSLELLTSQFSTNNLVKIISKKNGGQLSAFNEILRYVSGELIFFLDSDDLYKENYLTEVISIYKNNRDIDSIFCAHERIFSDRNVELISKYTSNKSLGYGVLSSYLNREWIGSVTSTISMKTSVFRSFMPINLEKDWITRADDCLVWGSSVVGAKKYFLSNPLVLYRVHGKNNYYNVKFSNDYLYKREISINKLFKHFSNASCIDFSNINVCELEYKSRNDISFSTFKNYLLINFKMQKSSFLKLLTMFKLSLFYIKCNIKLSR